MRVFVVFAACMAVVSAAPQSGFASSSAGALTQSVGDYFAGVLPRAVSGASAEARSGVRVGQGSVTIVPVPTTFTTTTKTSGGVEREIRTGVQATEEADYAKRYIGQNVQTYAQAAAKTDIIYATPVVEKSYFYHIAQEDASANAATNTLTITPRKYYKLIFIKAPTASANAAARARAASRTEEKTIVYVLVNKPVEADAYANANASASTFKYGKPEVYFIKYQGPQATSKSVSYSESFANAGAGGVVSTANANAASGATVRSGGLVGAGVQATANAASSAGGLDGGLIGTRANAAGYAGFGGIGAGASANAGASAIGGNSFQL